MGTPAYVYNAAAIRERYHTLDSALAGVTHRICFAVKANSTLAILRIMRDLGAGADIVSGGELARVLAAGFDPRQRRLQRRGKIGGRAAVGRPRGSRSPQCRIAEELERLARIAEEERIAVSVGIRVNPDVTTETHPYISTGKSGIKFGLPIDQVASAAGFIASQPRLELTTLAMHLGSQLVDTAPFQQGIARLLELVPAPESGTTTLKVLDIGGGLGIRYGDEPSMDPRRFRRRCRPDARAKRIHRLPRAGALSRRERRRSPHAGTLSEAFGRERVSRGGRRDERSRPARAITRLITRSSSWKSRGGRRREWMWSGLCARLGTFWRSIA